MRERPAERAMHFPTLLPPTRTNHAGVPMHQGASKIINFRTASPANFTPTAARAGRTSIQVCGPPRASHTVLLARPNHRRCTATGGRYIHGVNPASAAADSCKRVGVYTQAQLRRVVRETLGEDDEQTRGSVALAHS